jgi:hypothetical protein
MTIHTHSAAAQDLLKIPLNVAGDLHLANHRILKIERRDNNIIITTETGEKKFKPWKILNIERR